MLRFIGHFQPSVLPEWSRCSMYKSTLFRFCDVYINAESVAMGNVVAEKVFLPRNGIQTLENSYKENWFYFTTLIPSMFSL